MEIINFFNQAIQYFIRFVLHMDKELPLLVNSVGLWTYLLLFLVIFTETGVVVLPFLPGDSLLFAAGAIAASAELNIWLLFLAVSVAAILGDTVNYWIGHTIGERAFSGKIRWLKKEHLERTQAFYNKHGGKTIFLARFIPIVRTFAPFVAGVGKMDYKYFFSYNVIGGLVWTSVFLFTGFFFGNLTFVKENFSTVIIAIILISLLPVVFEFLNGRRKSRAEKIAGSDVSEKTAE